MKPRSIVAAALLLPAQQAAATIPAQEYHCSNQYGVTLRLILGDGEVQYWTQGGRWSGNLCDASSRCAFNGSSFDGGNDYFELHYDGASGSLSFDAMGLTEDDKELKGTCRPA